MAYGASKEMILGQPESLQPGDTTDKIIRFEAVVHGPGIEQLERVEFECAQCHKTYWREVVHQAHFTEVIEVEGIGKYALNPTLSSSYGPLLHQHSDASSI